MALNFSTAQISAISEYITSLMTKRVMADREFMRPVNPFMDWFNAWPGTTFHRDIEIVDLSTKGAGRGISKQQLRKSLLELSYTDLNSCQSGY